MKITNVIISYTVDLGESGKVIFEYKGTPIDEIPEPEQTKIKELLKLFHFSLEAKE